METEIDNATHYIELYENVRSKVGDEHVALAVLHELGKDRRMKEIRDERAGQLGASRNNGYRAGQGNTRAMNGEQSASSKQIGYLKSLGVEIPANLTKARASEMIDEAQNN